MENLPQFGIAGVAIAALMAILKIYAMSSKTINVHIDNSTKAMNNMAAAMTDTAVAMTRNAESNRGVASALADLKEEIRSKK